MGSSTGFGDGCGGDDDRASRLSPASAPPRRRGPPAFVSSLSLLPVATSEYAIAQIKTSNAVVPGWPEPSAVG